MVGFGLLCGHLLGDYILQNDWMAANKVNPHPGPFPEYTVGADSTDLPAFREALEKRNQELAKWPLARRAYWVGHLACLVHCLLYTLAVWLCSFWWIPWWGLLACFAIHFPIDRRRLARLWMEKVAGQRQFAREPLAPWSIVVVDNTFHLLTLFVIALVSGQ